MNAWRDAAAEHGSEALWWYDYGARSAARGADPTQLAPFTHVSAYLAGYYETKASAALVAAEAESAAPTRFAVALKALKKAERQGWWGEEPSCPVCQAPTSDDVWHRGSKRYVVVKRAIKHEADCELARALRWEVTP